MYPRVGVSLESIRVVTLVVGLSSSMLMTFLFEGILLG